MIRLNGSPRGPLRLSHSSNVPWLSRPVRSSVRARISTGLEDLGVLEGDRDLGGEQLDELELVEGERVAGFPSRSIVSTPMAPPRLRSGTTMRLPSFESPSLRWLTRGSVALVADVDRLVVLHDPGRHAGLAGRPGLQVEVAVDAAGRQRGQQPGGRIDDLDGDVVAGDQAAQSLGDALEDPPGGRAWSGSTR